MNNRTPRQKNECALNILVSTELKTALNEAARRYGVNVADIIRVSVRTTLPLLEVLIHSHDIIVSELIGHLGGRLRKRHGVLDSTEDIYESKQGSGPC